MQRQHQSPYTIATLLQDQHSHLPALPRLSQSDVILLLTPVVIPITHDPDDLSDPFEHLGRALSNRHAKIRHVPYINRNGITSTHVGFIKRAAVLVMVISDLKLAVRPAPRGEDDVSEPEERKREGEILQIRFAAIARSAFCGFGGRSQQRPFVLIVTCPVENKARILETNFGTVIFSKGYSKPALESTAGLMFGEHGNSHSTVRTENQEERSEPGRSGPPSAGQQSNTLILQEAIALPAISQPLATRTTPNPENQAEPPTSMQPEPQYEWTPEQWDEEEDLIPVHTLWNQTMDPRFRIPSPTYLASLLNRTGYARHYVIYSPKSGSSETDENAGGKILGFAATYLTYIDQEGEKLLGSLAIILVHPSFRGRGIGTSLHDFAISQLRDTAGVRRLQLGSLWPRILFGSLCGPHSRTGDTPVKPVIVEEQVEGDIIMHWFQKRGWAITPINPLQAQNQIVPQGQGKPVHDLILPFTAWKPISTPPPSTASSRRNSASPKNKKQKLLPTPSTPQEKVSFGRGEKLRFMKSHITFRQCTQADMASVLGLVDEAADIEGDNLGWYDQYSRLSNEIYVKDIIVATMTSSSAALLINTGSNGGAGRNNGFGGSGQEGLGVERTKLVGCALTYTPGIGNPVAGDLPWAGLGGVGVGPDVGGVCCVCVSGTYFLLSRRRPGWCFFRSRRLEMDEYC